MFNFFQVKEWKTFREIVPGPSFAGYIEQLKAQRLWFESSELPNYERTFAQQEKLKGHLRRGEGFPVNVKK